MKNLISLYIIILFIGFLSSCSEENEITYLTPKDYLPAYPGSYWDYTNGERIKVALDYQAHSYEEGVNTTAWSPTTYVPVMDGEYIYEYSIFQHSTSFPLKKLLSESNNDTWQINQINNQAIWRKVISTSEVLWINFIDSTTLVDSLKNVIVVVEFIDSLGEDRWNTKEYYAKNIGLIKQEFNNPYDTLESVTAKELNRVYINKP